MNDSNVKTTLPGQLAVLDGDGREVPISSFAADGPAVLVFLRQFG